MGNDILVTLNEIQQALDDLSFDPGGGEQGAAQILNDIANKVEALRSTYETRSVAETTAQNTNFADLINALDARVPQYITIPRGGGCCCGGIVADRPESDDATEFDPPPTNWEETDEGGGTPAYYSRKCKVANAIHFSVREYIQVLQDNGADTLGATAKLVVITGLVAAGFGAITTPGFIIDDAVYGVVGALAVIAVAIFNALGALNFGQVLNIMDNNESDLICALYESNDATTAISDYRNILDNGGISFENKQVVSAILIADVVNNLYFKSSEAIEAELATYTPPYDCAGCDPGCENRASKGAITSDNGSQIVGDGTNNCWIVMDGDANYQNCGDAFTISNFQITSGSVTPPGGQNQAFRFYSVAPPPDSDGDIYNSDNAPQITDVFNGVRYLLVSSTTPFTMEFDYQVE